MLPSGLVVALDLEEFASSVTIVYRFRPSDVARYNHRYAGVLLEVFFAHMFVKLADDSGLVHPFLWGPISAPIARNCGLSTASSIIALAALTVAKPECRLVTTSCHYPFRSL